MDKKYFFPRRRLNVYFDIQNLYGGYQVELQENITVVRNVAGLPVIDSENPASYLGKLLPNTSGTTVSTPGMIVEL